MKETWGPPTDGWPVFGPNGKRVTVARVLDADVYKVQYNGGPVVIPAEDAARYGLSSVEDFANHIASGRYADAELVRMAGGPATDKCDEELGLRASAP